ncbi:MAG: 3-oxoacyl-ACP reductase FabG [candidate division KSB1 bacterium]|nr:3-oxoacyl-ACP reductase FabG [candidate division KSB1 bacterium]MDZ7341626.1 3-oxoacyl-ACP reductase FabG [candidate division KSB1 bacterium]
MGRLDGRIAIITGGAQGIGYAAVEKFARENAQVVFWDVNADKGQAAVTQLQAKQLHVDFQEVNVTHLAAAEAAAKQVVDKYGRIDILINNAGILRDATLMKMTAEDWQQVIDVNLTGVFNCTKAVAPYMIQQKSGRIINVSSIVGLYGNFGQTNYVAAKSGIIGMTRVWARELGRKGITVNAIAPGFIATEMVQTVPEKVIQAIIEKTPLGRLGTPEDIANAFLFLASDEASFINGIVLSVDGGLVV